MTQRPASSQQPPLSGGAAGAVPPARPDTVREIIRSNVAHGAIMAERNGGFPCDVCNVHRLIAFTVLAPLVKGKTRPRIALDTQPAITVCWRCILKPVLRLFTRRAKRKGAV
jgi:hypothetical protein